MEYKKLLCTSDQSRRTASMDAIEVLGGGHQTPEGAGNISCSDILSFSYFRVILSNL